MAIRGYANGESFVARNVGLKSVWEKGDWQVHPVFMDHDDLQLPKSDSRYLSASSVWNGTQKDARHILGDHNLGGFQRGEIPLLQSIYRVSSDVSRTGQKLFDAVLAASYRRTQTAMRAKPAMRALFHETFIEHIGDWDHAVTLFLRSPDGASWEPAAKAFLAARGHSEKQVDDTVGAIKRHSAFLHQLASLYLGGPE
jgi:hypothetical protein